MRLVAAFAISILLGARLCASRTTTTYVTFDPPGSIYTWVTGMNDAGQVVGTYRDSNILVHSFLRNTDGSFVEFDPPGATESQALSINESGEITGIWNTSAPGIQGYYRDAAGNITTFQEQASGTYACCINNGGSILGRTGSEGFVRDASGTITLFNPNGSALTIPESFNQLGFIGGTYYDSKSVLHGFILGPSRTYTIVNVPGGGTKMGEGTNGVFINDSGTATGAYVDSSKLYHGYVRSKAGVYTTFDVPSNSKLTATEPLAINNIGEVVGFGENIFGLQEGFTRDSSGKITVFQVPGAGLNNENYQGTSPVAINSSGTTAGLYYDSNQVAHGFLRFQ